MKSFALDTQRPFWLSDDDLTIEFSIVHNIKMQTIKPDVTFQTKVSTYDFHLTFFSIGFSAPGILLGLAKEINSRFILHFSIKIPSNSIRIIFIHRKNMTLVQFNANDQ